MKMPDASKPKLPEKLRQLMDGKKTYSDAVALIVLAIVQGTTGMDIPQYVWAILGAAGLVFLRVAVKKGR